ncbi:hypothetical protein [Streptomyces sp. WAC 04229]|uniref:hypothetical protein n=1 Tax=Streptomyces sp. WAC 04229 TaxID=2203206 RepID=UPI00163D2227|nr:hypothetical protein [Streptomyces sp. WAC 04229]
MRDLLDDRRSQLPYQQIPAGERGLVEVRVVLLGDVVLGGDLARLGSRRAGRGRRAPRTTAAVPGPASAAGVRGQL